MPSSTTSDVWLTTEEAAAFLGYSVAYTAAWLNTKEFALTVKTARGQIVVLESALRDWIVKHDIQKPLSKEAMVKVRNEFLAGGWEPLDDSLPINQAPDYEAVLAKRAESMANRPKTRSPKEGY